MAAVRAARYTGLKRGLGLVYHEITQGPDRGEDRIVPPVDRDLFRWQLEYLVRHYRLVPASELQAAALERRPGERFPVTVTFDDDLRSHARLAMPALLEAGAPATFFVCGASLERPYAFWWETLERAARAGLVTPGAGGLQAEAARVQSMEAGDRDGMIEAFERQLGPVPDEFGMPAADVEALSAAGFEIGFHTLRHPVLPTLRDHELDAAMVAGRAALESAAGRGLKAIAYPHGRGDERVANAARRAGLGAGFTTAQEPVRDDTDPLLVGRIYPPVAKADFATGVATALLGRAG